MRKLATALPLAFLMILDPSLSFALTSCRESWKEYKDWPIGGGRHKAFAALKTPNYMTTCFWWHDADSVEAAEYFAVQRCNQWKAGSCEVVDVDGVPKKANLEKLFSENVFAPVAVEIYDKPSDKKQVMNGYVLFDAPEEGDETRVSLISNRKQLICAGNYSQVPQLSHDLPVSGVCFGKYSFTNPIRITGARYVNGIQVGFSFEGTFSYNGSYVHIVSK